MERAKESAMWRYFTFATPTSSTAVCNVWVNVSRCGGSAAKYDTTNLIKPIKKHRAKEHAEFLQLNKTKGAGDSTAQQLTLAGALQRREKFPTESLKASAITQNVLEVFVLDAQPMSVVEDEGFHRPLEYLEPRYSLSSRKYFSKTSLQFII